jgi:hypothetical protein
MNDLDPGDELITRLEAKLEPWRIRSTLAFAGLFQMTHEMIKRSVLEEVKGFYGFSYAMGTPVWLLGQFDIPIPPSPQAGRSRQPL